MLVFLSVVHVISVCRDVSTSACKSAKNVTLVENL